MKQRMISALTATLVNQESGVFVITLKGMILGEYAHLLAFLESDEKIDPTPMSL